MHRKAGSFVEEFVRCIVRGSTLALASTVELTFWNGLDTQADIPTVALRTYTYAIKSSALTDRASASGSAF